MSFQYKLPIEQQTKDEAKLLESCWDSGAFNFLIQRTQEKYNLKIIKQRRLKNESNSKSEFPAINDKMLLSLYKAACIKYMRECHKKYGCHSGFNSTPQERKFLTNIESIIKCNPKLKHLEIYPSILHSKDFPNNFKMVIGNYVPDFIIFGLKVEGASALALEINGDSHLDKYKKDELRSDHLKELKISTLEIPNEKVNDLTFLTDLLMQTYKLRNGSFNDQINRAKRRIWLKTICCQLSFTEIEDHIKNIFFIKLNLLEEVKFLKKDQTTPRKIKMELNLLVDSQNRPSVA